MITKGTAYVDMSIKKYIYLSEVILPTDEKDQKTKLVLFPCRIMQCKQNCLQYATLYTQILTVSDGGIKAYLRTHGIRR